MAAPHTTRLRTTRPRLEPVTALLALALAALATPVTAGDRSDHTETGLSGSELVHALRNGGYVIYFRHAQTDHAQTDSDRVNLENCETQRGLSESGRDQARAIGRAFKALGIPVAQVVSSPYCRCLDTGRLAFGDVSVADDLGSAIGQTRSETIRSAGALRIRLGNPPPPGTNTVLVSHTANLKEAAGIWPDPEGVAIVFRPDRAKGFSSVARVLPEEWTELARAR